MVLLQGAWDIALALAGSVEADHRGKPSFRVDGKIFATVPDPRHLNVMIDPFDVDAVLREHPGCCSQLLWGKEIRGVQVTLSKAPRKVVVALLESAWRRKAPRRASTPLSLTLHLRGRESPQQPFRSRGLAATETEKRPRTG